VGDRALIDREALFGIMEDGARAFREGKRCDENPYGPIGSFSIPAPDGGVFHGPNCSGAHFQKHETWELGWMRAAKDKAEGETFVR
jgi:hypothetical protein